MSYDPGTMAFFFVNQKLTFKANPQNAFTHNDLDLTKISTTLTSIQSIFLPIMEIIQPKS